MNILIDGKVLSFVSHGLVYLTSKSKNHMHLLLAEDCLNKIKTALNQNVKVELEVENGIKYDGEDETEYSTVHRIKSIKLTSKCVIGLSYDNGAKQYSFIRIKCGKRDERVW